MWKFFGNLWMKVFILRWCNIVILYRVIYVYLKVILFMRVMSLDGFKLIWLRILFILIKWLFICSIEIEGWLKVCIKIWRIMFLFRKFIFWCVKWILFFGMMFCYFFIKSLVLEKLVGCRCGELLYY